MLPIKKCPTCSSRKIKLVHRSVTRHLGRDTVTVPNVAFYECPDCGEKVSDQNAMRKLESHAHADSHSVA